jgi:magnesium transporter
MEERKIIIRELLAKHPADVAEVLSGLDEEQAIDLVHRLVLRKAAAGPLGEMEPEDSAELFEGLDREEALGILSRMDPDDAVDLLEELPPNTQQELLSRLESDEARVLAGLLIYPPDTAGGLMSPEVAALPLDMTAQEAIELLRERVEEVETVYYAYAVDAEKRLQGVISLRDLVLARPQTRIYELLQKEIVTIPAELDVEEVARLFDRYNYLALPVVDAAGRLLGVITVDDVIDVIRDEATEDIYGMVSAPTEERVDTKLVSSLRMRLPWLYVRLMTALLAAVVVGLFEETIAKVAALAVFMGVIAGQGGSAGMQTVAIITRGMALGEFERKDGLRLLGKEALLGFINGLIIGATVGLITWMWKGDYILGVAVFVAMMLNLVVAGVAGVAVPLVMQALGKDPALASGILLPTMTDVLGFGLLFLLAISLIPGL